MFYSTKIYAFIRGQVNKYIQILRDDARSIPIHLFLVSVNCN